ncbi:unnamed protein product [Nippostrongylus brasiliensis]|uniref:Putative tyrosinase-like protein tyr-3 (inferred by orthology to a C. elegans protein) n=1 Tax=Nippostrongylus brasiliensis TaxID=27835 RepID=A0A0N4YPX6_NIPBR|nr:unnamed protein product [Nippostrongylus brasiliensis]
MAEFLLLWMAVVFQTTVVIWSLDCSKAPSEAMRVRELVEIFLRMSRKLLSLPQKRESSGKVAEAHVWIEPRHLQKTPAPTSVKPPAIPGQPQLAADFAPIASNMYQCMDMACLCVFFRGTGGSSCTVQGRKLEKAVRKEYRQLSDDERNRLHAAFQGIKSRVEIALRQIDPEVSLPYWDSTLDQNMPDSRDSILWTNEFFGESTGGVVVGGPFREFRTLEGLPRIRRDIGAKGKLFSEDEIDFFLSQRDINQVLAFSAPKEGLPRIRRDIGAKGKLFSEDEIDFFLSQRDINQVLAFSAPKEGCPFQPSFNALEYTHGNVHIYVGGEMYDQATAGNDPTFYLHHAVTSDFNSLRYLYCDRSHGQPRCASKIKPGGNCAGLTNGEDACYNGQCVGGRCVAGSVQTTTPPPITPKKPVVVIQQTCYNEHECCSPWANMGECRRNYIYMSEWCKASCGVCKPNYDLQNECLDRHTSCSMWARSGECNKNPWWMSENCRSACGKCGLSRSVICSGGGGQAQGARCTSPMCYNENQCCPVWASQGQCQANPGFMLCQCRVSCQQCQPNYRYGICADYHNDCMKWARSGECNRNTWMPENCRRSCGTCVNMYVSINRYISIN